MRCASAACATVLAAGAVAVPVRAEPIEVRLSGGGAIAVGGYQQREFGPGADLAMSLEYRVAPSFKAALLAEGLLLSDGAEPRNPEFANNNGASLGALMLGAHLHVGHGVWVAVNGGCGLTGGVFRPVGRATLGYDVNRSWGEEVIWGPVIEWVHLFQPNTAVRPEDANLLVAGLHIAFDAPWSNAPLGVGSEAQP